MTALPVADAATTRFFHDWLTIFSGHVRAVDYAAARPLVHPDVVIFGTHTDVLKSLDTWVAQQWDNVWPKTEDFTFDLAQTHVLVSDDASLATVVAPWTSTGFHPDGEKFPRPGRATLVFHKGDDGWKIVHSHMSLNRGVPQTSHADRPSKRADLDLTAPRSGAEVPADLERPRTMAHGHDTPNGAAPRLRSRRWFDEPSDPGMTALYLERYMNYGITREELQGGKPIIGIAQTGSDLSPCNRHHLELAKRVRDGIRDGGRRAVRIPGAPDPGDRQAPDRRARPQPGLSRPRRGAARLPARRRGADHRLRQDHACLPDGVRPRSTSRRSCCPAARCSTAGGSGKLAGSGTIVWEGRKMLAEGKIGYEEFMEMVASSAPSVGHCNTMGTALSMNSLAEALGMSLPGCASIPGPHRERGQMAYETGQAHRGHGAREPAPVRHHDAGGVRERGRRCGRARRILQLSDPHGGHRPPHGRRAHAGRTGSASARKFPCWSIASRPDDSWARRSSAPAACRR